MSFTKVELVKGKVWAMDEQGRVYLFSFDDIDYPVGRLVTTIKPTPDNFTRLHKW